MNNHFKLTPDMENYFNSLPLNIQHELVMSGTKAQSLDDLKAIVDTISGNGENNEK